MTVVLCATSQTTPPSPAAYARNVETWKPEWKQDHCKRVASLKKQSHGGDYSTDIDHHTQRYQNHQLLITRLSSRVLRCLLFQMITRACAWVSSHLRTRPKEPEDAPLSYKDVRNAPWWNMLGECLHDPATCVHDGIYIAPHHEASQVNILCARQKSGQGMSRKILSQHPCVLNSKHSVHCLHPRNWKTRNAKLSRRNPAWKLSEF